MVFRSPVTPSRDDGAGLVHVASVDPREPHRPPVRWGSPGRLTRFVGIASAPGDMAVPAWWPRPSASWMTGPRPSPWRRGRCESHTTRPPIYRVPINILITKHGILGAMGTDTDSKRRACGDGSPPEDIMHTAPDSHAAQGARLADGRMNEEADRYVTRREGARSDGVYRGVTVTTDQPPPATGAGPARQTVKACIIPVIHPLTRLTI